MNRLFVLLLGICFLLTGCVKQQILEKITLATVCAYDEAPNDQIELTIAAPMFEPGKSGSVTNKLYSKVGYTSRNILQSMNLRLNRPIHPGKISVALYGKELAAKGVADEMEVSSRDAQSSRKKYMAVVDGKAKELLQAKFSSNEEKGMFLFNLLDTNARTGLVPVQNLHEFEYSYMGKGMDPFLPLLQLQNEQVLISGIALFKDDKYVRSLNEKQMRVMKLLLEDAKHGTLEAKLDNGSNIAVVNVGSKVNYRVGKDSKGPKVAISLTLNGEILESKGMLYPSQEKRTIKDRFETDLVATGTELIQLFKKEGIDPLGLGDIVRSKTRNWNEEEWKQKYRTLDVKLNVKVNFPETGIRK
ncbi:Ger(x)C family spore germination protein [Paenibacillus arenilitoris]|uniref:Ger(X)C family spore germination protein n=1 Tax=Paenibacillus arenilitoris TaxID=2772299 RepID=A0A927H7W0_9BACL|nr:Ger(x)C family spore germination protein [Paenibacillus arenilitoris]MBD2872056.1 Ger(x)C family spore germination protein [Paenibacillus arenilitoris]